MLVEVARLLCSHYRFVRLYQIGQQRLHAAIHLRFCLRGGANIWVTVVDEVLCEAFEPVLVDPQPRDYQLLRKLLSLQGTPVKLPLEGPFRRRASLGPHAKTPSTLPLDHSCMWTALHHCFLLPWHVCPIPFQLHNTRRRHLLLHCLCCTPHSFTSA